MTTTQNLHLPQWEETDRIQMDDFNDAMAKIDAALANAETKLAEATASQNCSRLDLDLSQIDCTEYRKIEIVIHRPDPQNGWMLRVNNSENYIYKNSADSSSTLNTLGCIALVQCGPQHTPTFSIRFHQPGEDIPVACSFSYAYYSNDTSWGISGGTAVCRNITWDQVTSLNLLPYSGTLPAGTTITLYGAKR